MGNQKRLKLVERKNVKNCEESDNKEFICKSDSES